MLVFQTKKPTVSSPARRTRQRLRSRRTLPTGRALPAHAASPRSGRRGAPLPPVLTEAHEERGQRRVLWTQPGLKFDHNRYRQTGEAATAPGLQNITAAVR